MESCNVTSASRLIAVECPLLATGFQMIAQLSNSSAVHKLYTNKTTDHQALASVEVEESGTYQVTIFAIRGETGILDSTVQHSVAVVTSASNLPTMPSLPTAATIMTPTPGNSMFIDMKGLI